MLAEFAIKKIRIFSIGLTAIFCLIFGISVSRSESYEYKVPEKLDDGWETASLQEVGVDSKKISELIRGINKTDMNVYAVLLVKNGKLILEEYLKDGRRNKRYNIHSVTKSIGSVLTGIAIDETDIENADEKMYRLLEKNWPDEQWSEGEKQVTIRNLLTMTSGYDCDDHEIRIVDETPQTHPCQMEMNNSSDWVDFILKKQVLYTPGDHWAYNSSTPMLLAEIIIAASEGSIQNFADKHLWQPLGIRDGVDFKWYYAPPNQKDPYNNPRVFFAGQARMKPRAMAKLGYMMLNDGRWNGEPIVSQTWVSESTRPLYTTTRNFKYGYMWWWGRMQAATYENNTYTSKPIEAFWAAGVNGQRIFIVRDLRLVAVFAGDLPNQKGISTHGMMTSYIIPACLPNARNALERKGIELAAGTTQKYAGLYEFKKDDRTFEIRSYGNGKNLKVESCKWKGRKAFKGFDLWPETKNRFLGWSRELGDIFIEFTPDAGGNVTHLTVNFAFTSWKCEKRPY